LGNNVGLSLPPIDVTAGNSILVTVGTHTVQTAPSLSS
jgi:hypothetical protein